MSSIFRLALPMIILVSTWALPARAVDTDVVLNEAFYLGDDTEDWVELKNMGKDTINVANWWLCSRLVYVRLATLPLLDGDDLVLEPGEILTVGAGMDLDDFSADLGLYVTNEFPESSAMVDFFQWGTTDPVGRSSVAAEKLAWRQETRMIYDAVEAAVEGESVSFCGANSGGALLTLSEDLENGSSTRGAENGFSCSLLFADGFESGDVSAWTLAVPMPLEDANTLDHLAVQSILSLSR
ncbi:MAG: lamin tail domain-containing protein [Deltaproteobacteria bacterium]|nr:lamin tail domain-containing protein [Deltaproteobacteria bacterium]